MIEILDFFLLDAKSSSGQKICHHMQYDKNALYAFWMKGQLVSKDGINFVLTCMHSIIKKT